MKAAMLDNLKDATESRTSRIGRARRFLSDVRAELGRVTWPSRREVWATTLVVILTSMVFGIYLAVIDFGLTSLVSWLYRLVG
jgi:preprotein translocase subunit SecE